MKHMKTPIPVYIVAMQACNLESEWVWLTQTFRTEKEANEEYTKAKKAVEMWPKDYKNPQKPQKVFIEVNV